MAQVRAAAAHCVDSVIRHRKSLTEVLPTASAGVPDRDKGLLKALVYQTLRYGFSLRHQVEGALAKPLRNKDQDITALLMVGLCQIRYLNVADHAAVNATVEATRVLRKVWARGLVNAVLRKALRNELAEPPCDPTVHWNHPQWLIDYIQAAWPDDAGVVLGCAQQQGPMTLRVNPLRQDRGTYQKLLDAEGIECRRTRFSTDGLTLASAVDVTRLPGFGDGACSVQDESGQMAVHWLDPQPGEQVLDACAAPGSKTGHILERLAGSGRVTAMDNQASRLDRLSENLDRLSLTAELCVGDAQELDDRFDAEAFDRILLDVPCTGTGVIRRHPDIKWLRKPHDVPRLAAVQARILNAAWRVLKRGGTLMYSTCSILPDENNHQIRAFLERTPEATVMPVTRARPGPQERFPGEGRQWLPEKDGADGFYYMLLRKDKTPMIKGDS